MPLFYQHNINEDTRIGVWHIVEDEGYFLKKVPLKKYITHWHKRLQHLAGRYLLQEMFPDFPYEQIEIADTRKPFLPNEKYHFSISHCSDYAAVIVSRTSRVGIDIEVPTAKVEKVKHKFLNEHELKYVPEADVITIGVSRSEVLTTFWSCKEAVFKWAGDGGVDFRDHIHLDVYPLINKKGTISAAFKKADPILLDLHYELLDGTTLVYVSFQ